MVRMSFSKPLIGILRDRNFVRLLLIIVLSFYLPGMSFFTSMARVESPKDIPAEAENGIGGGLNPESLLESELEFDPELAGIPEAEEYSSPHMLTYGSYTLESGDIIGNIAVMTGLNEDTLISVNNIRNARLLQIGQVIRIPNQDGIFYEVKPGDTLASIAEEYRTTVSGINTANELFSENIRPGSRLFIPGGRMDWISRQEINGDLFIWPSSGSITSPYGWRLDPFGGGARQFHTGVDIASHAGAPVRASMSGRVAHAGFDESFGNFIIINHHSGYRTLYAHMSVLRVRAGAYVATGQRIGDVGASGRATGPHLHFTVFKNGVTVNPRSLMR